MKTFIETVKEKLGLKQFSLINHKDYVEIAIPMTREQFEYCRYEHEFYVEVNKQFLGTWYLN